MFSKIKEFIEKNTAISVLKGMIADGLYISSEVYNGFLELLGTLKK